MIKSSDTYFPDNLYPDNPNSLYFLLSTSKFDLGGFDCTS